MHAREARRLGYVATSRALATCALLLTGCGGGAAGSSTPTTATSSTRTAPVRLTFTVPTGVHEASARARQYVSPSTQSLTVAVTAADGTSSPPTSVACTSTCSAVFQAPIGSDTIALKLTDGPNGSGNQLSLSTTTVTVVANTTNTFNLTANPVVAGVTVQVGAVPSATVAVNAGAAADVPVTISAFDAAGSRIVGPGNYVDRSGTPLTVRLSVTNAQAGGRGTVTLSTTSLTSPPTGSITAHYDAGWLDHSTITASTSSASVSVGSPATVSTTPTDYEYPGTTGSGYGQIAAGTDGRVWFSEPGAALVGAISTSGTITEYPTISPSSTNGITAGPDGNMWFTEAGANKIGRITPGGSVVEFSVPTTSAGVGQIAAGPDGNLWFVETSADQIGKITPSGGVTEYPIPTAGQGPTSIVAGPDGKLWFTWFSGYCQIGNVTTSGVVTMFGSGCFVPNRIIVAPDGTLWAPSYGNFYVITIDTTGVQSGFNLGYALTGAAAGVDGNVWGAVRASNNLVMITTSGTATPFPIGGDAWDVATGPDGSIWYTMWGLNKIGKFVY